MIYRDDELAAGAMIRSLQREIAALGGEAQVEAVRSLRKRLHRETQRGRRTDRALARHHGGRLWLVPRSVTELVVAGALAYASFTLILGLAYLALCFVALV